MSDDSYTKIPNDLLNALAMYKFNGRQRAIIDVICRYTFGFNRDRWKIPLALFETISGIKRTNLSMEISNLIKDKVIVVVGEPLKTEVKTFRVNMNFSQWEIEKREQGTIIENDNSSIIKNDNSTIIDNDNSLLLNSITNYYQKQEQAIIENDNHIIKIFNNNFNNKNPNNKIVDTVSTLPTTPTFADDGFERLCVESIIHSCLELYPNSKVPKTDEEKNKWALDIERMKRLDNRTEDEIKQALQFAIGDSFWKSNIRSTKKFREKYETLYIQSEQKKTVKQNKGQQLQDEFVKSAKEWYLNE